MSKPEMDSEPYECSQVGYERCPLHKKIAEARLAGALAMQEAGVASCAVPCRTAATEEACRGGLAIAGQRLALIDPKNLKGGK